MGTTTCTFKKRRSDFRARGRKEKLGRSADSSGSKVGARGESTLKGLVIVAGAGSSNASGRASFVSVFFFWWKEERGVR